MDFKSCRHDISTIPEGRAVIEHFADLAEYKEFRENKNDALARIAILATDEGSPFVRTERDDYEKRIKAIMEYLQIDDQKLLKSIVYGRELVFNGLVNRYFILCDNLVYSMWSNMVRNFNYIGVALREPPDMKNMVADMSKRAALQKQQSELHEGLIRYETQIFPDNTTRKIIRQELAKILQLPEKYAQPKGVI